MTQLYIKDRFLHRSSWRRLKRGEYDERYCEADGFRGVVGVLKLIEFGEPLRVEVCGREEVIADVGYTWVELLPQGGHWCLTAMYTPALELVQVYFDLTLENFIESPAHFRDLFLDITVDPDGNCRLLDEDELDTALELGVIGAASHKLAHDTARELVRAFPERIGELDEFLKSRIRLTNSK